MQKAKRRRATSIVENSPALQSWKSSSKKEVFAQPSALDCGVRVHRFRGGVCVTADSGAELQELVKAAIESNGGRITTSQNTSPREDGRFKQIGVNVQFFATTPALQKLLGALETQQPYLLVDNITVRPLNAFRGFKPGPGMEPEVNVQLDVSAFAYADVKPVAATTAAAAPK